MEENRNRMLADWDPVTGFEALSNQLEEGSLYATFAGRPMSEMDVIDIGTQVVLKTSVFQTQYEEWINMPNNHKSFGQWKRY